MNGALSIEVVRPADLDPEARRLWAQFRAAREDLASPYFDLRYVLAAGEVAPHAAVAVIRRSGRIAGFLPFQRRGSLIQPLAAPLTDYHGLICLPDADIALGEVVEGLGGRRLRFSGLVGSAAGGRELQPRRAMVADLSGGLEAYLQRRSAAGQGAAFKDKRRRARALARDHGAPAFTFGRESGEVLDLIIRLKRAQMRRTGQHDVFANAWTRRVLQRLAKADAEDFGLRFAALRVGGRVIAAEVGLRSGDAYHLWLPVYDPAFARYSPGALMTLETLAALAADGVRTVDFGPADEAYKRMFADPGAAVWEGQVDLGPAAFGAHLDAAPMFPVVRRTWRAAVRRLDRIAACEPTRTGQLAAAAATVAALGRRHPRKALALGVAAGLNIGVLVFD